MILLLAIANTLTVAQNQPNVDTILNNNIILNSYIRCILGTGKCNREGEQLKGKCIFNVIEIFLNIPLNAFKEHEPINFFHLLSILLQ